MGLEQQHGHGAGNGQGIHHDELALGILGQQLFPGGVHRLNGAAQLAGESHKEQILLLQNGLEILHIISLIQCGSDRRGTGAHFVKVGVLVHGLA